MAEQGADALFISRKWPPAVGGMETYSLRLTQSLAEQVKLEVFALPGQANGAAPSFTSLLAFFVRSLGRLMSSPRYKVIHIGDLALWPVGWAAQFFSRCDRLLISAHGRDVSLASEQGWKARAYRAYLAAGVRLIRSANVIANSTYIADLSRQAGFESVSVIPLGTDFGAPDAAARQHLLFAGRITRAKGLRFLVEQVLPLLPADVRLRVAGTIWETEEVSLLEHGRVDYVGALDGRELAIEFSQARAVLVPSRTSEGFGLIAIEAAACGAFVIASEHSGLAEVVTPSIGALANANDPQAWATAIRSVLAMSDEQYLAHSRQARETVEQEYRWPRVADATAKLYRLD